MNKSRKVKKVAPKNSRIAKKFIPLKTFVIFFVAKMADDTVFKVNVLQQQLYQRDIEIARLQELLKQQGHHQQKISPSSFSEVPKLPDIATNYDNLVEELIGKETAVPEELVIEKQAWNGIFANQYNTYRLSGEKKEKYWNTRRRIVVFMFSWFLRMKNQHYKPQEQVRLSIFLWHHGCRQPIWRLFQKLKLCMSYEWTRKFMDHAIKIPLPEKLNWQTSTSVAIFGADNCAYYNHQNFVRDGKSSHFLSTINWYQCHWISPNKLMMHDGDDIFPGRFDDNAVKLRFVEILANKFAIFGNKFAIVAVFASFSDFFVFFACV
jgi:hypothetical protein